MLESGEAEENKYMQVRSAGEGASTVLRVVFPEKVRWVHT